MPPRPPSLLAVVLLFALPALASAADSCPDYLTIPNGVTDPEGKVGYLTNPEVLGGIDAVNLEDGKTLWNSKEGTRPIALVGKKLVAQRTNLRTYTITVLDTADKGKLLLESKPLTFPDWVSLYNVPGRRFSSEVWLDGGDAVVKWEAHGFYAGGVTLPPRLLPAYDKDAAGYARVSLSSGDVEMLPPAKAPPRPTLKLPPELADVARGGTVIGNKVVLAAVEAAGQEQKLVLKSWDPTTGKADEPQVLFSGQALDVETVAGGREVLVRQALPK